MASPFDSLFLGGDHQVSQDGFADFDEPVSAEFSFESHPTTVSPQDLWADDSIIMSNPASTAFPNLSTPQTDYLDSPGLTSGLNTTPMDDGSLDAQLNFPELASYPSLFPEESCDQFGHAGTPAIASNSSFDSLTDLRTSAQPSPMVRQKSSPGRPPVTAASHLRKHSLTNGVSKAALAKSRKPLPEISIESEDDKETAKRKKNTAAARKSRQRKAEIMDAYAAEIQRLRQLVLTMGGNPDPPTPIDDFE